MGNNIIFDSLTCIQLHKSVNSFFLTPITKQVISTSTNHYHRNWRYVSFAFANWNTPVLVTMWTCLNMVSNLQVGHRSENWACNCNQDSFMV